MMFCDMFLCLQRKLGSVTQYWVTIHILYMLYIQKPLLLQIHWLSVKNDKTIIIFMRLRWCLNFLNDGMEL